MLMLTTKRVQLPKTIDINHVEKVIRYLNEVTIWLAAGQHFEKLNDRQFKIHTHMRTGDLLALRFFLLPADRCSSDRMLKYFVLNVRRLINNTQHGLLTFLKTKY